MLDGNWNIQVLQYAESYSMGESLWNCQNRKAQQQEISYILYVNIIAMLCFQNGILFQNRQLSPIHIATQSGNQTWTLNEYPGFTKSINHDLRTKVWGQTVRQWSERDNLIMEESPTCTIHSLFALAMISRSSQKNAESDRLIWNEKYRSSIRDTVFDLIGARGAYVNLFSTTSAKLSSSGR